MREIIWKSNYDIGVPEIDSQHRMFLRLVKKIREEREGGVVNEKMKRLLRELIKYAEYHFCSEENIMFESDYPELKEHSRIHEELIAELRNRVFALHFDISDYDSLENFLVDWFFNHVVDDDREFAMHVKEG